MTGAGDTPHPVPLPSIRQRLVRTVVAVSVTWMLATSLVVGLSLRHQVDQLADAGLQESTEWLYGLMTTAPALNLDEGGSLPAPPHTEQVIWQRVSAQGLLLMRSHQAPAEPFYTRATPGLSNAPGRWRVYGMALPGDRSMLYLAERQSERQAAWLAASWAALAGTLLMGALFVLGLRHLIRQELRPLLMLSQAIARHDPTQARLDLPTVNREELQPIREAVIGMGQRLRMRMDSERAFSAHAAHALRTPLAGIDAQLAVALRECPPQVRPRLQRTRQAAQRLKRVVSSLLTLFRTGMELHRDHVDLAKLTEAMAMDTLTIRVTDPCEVNADPDLLAAALMNLLDNVVRHGGRHVTLRVHTDDRFQVVALTDDGPGMTPPELRRLQMALALQHYQEHTGLGLMLADLVARAHGGSVQLSDSDTGCGLRVELILRRPARRTTVRG